MWKLRPFWHAQVDIQAVPNDLGIKIMTKIIPGDDWSFLPLLTAWPQPKPTKEDTR